jgi:hypothetical protein
MRSDWVPVSASALVIGAMALVFGGLLNPTDPGSSTAETIRVVSEDSGRSLGMSVMYFLASVTLVLGLPAVLTLFDRRGRRTGLVGAVLFAVGAIGTCGYAMLMVFFRALVVADALRTGALDDVTGDQGLAWFLYGWIGCFYGGVLLLAVGLLLARSTPRWVPLMLLAFVVLLPFGEQLGRVGGAVQVLLLAIAFTGIAMAAVTDEHRARVPAHSLI